MSVQESWNCWDILYTISDSQSNTISTVFMASISKIIEDLVAYIGNDPVTLTYPGEVTPELTIDVAKHSQRTNKFIYDITCAMTADTSVKNTITDRVIASAANSQFKKSAESIVSSGSQEPIVAHIAPA